MPIVGFIKVALELELYRCMRIEGKQFQMEGGEKENGWKSPERDHTRSKESI